MNLARKTDTEGAPSLLKHFRGHRDAILGLDFHPNLPQVVSCGADEHITIWNYKQETRALRYEGHKGKIYDVRFSKDGDLMVTAGEDLTIRIWVPTIKGEVRSFKGHSAKIRSVAFSPVNSSLVASGSNDKTIKLWSVERSKSSQKPPKIGTFLKSFYNLHTNWIRSVRFSNDGNMLVSASDDNSLIVLDVRSYKTVAKIPCHLGTPMYADFNPCAPHYIGTSTEDQAFTVYDLRKSQIVQVYQKLQKGSVNKFAFHPSGDFAATVGDDATIKILDLIEGRPIYTLHGPREALYTVAFSPDGGLLATAGSDRELLVWEPNLTAYGDGSNGDAKENEAVASNSSSSSSSHSSMTETLSNASRSSKNKTPVSSSASSGFNFKSSR